MSNEAANLALTNAMNQVQMDMRITTDDVIAIQVAAKEQELLATKKALTNEITGLKKQEVQLGKDIETAVSNQLKNKREEILNLANALKPHGVTKVTATTNLTGNETKKVELAVTIKTGNNDGYGTPQITLGHSEPPNDEVNRLLAEKATTTTTKAEKQAALSETMNELQNLATIERQARSKFAQAKLGGNATPLVSLMLSE